MSSASPDSQQRYARPPGQGSLDGRGEEAPTQRYAGPPGQGSLDGRGGKGPTTASNKGPRYLYYRIYTKYCAINTNNPIYANDPFTSRTLSKLITPPHTALSIKYHLCDIEGFPSNTISSLFETPFSQVADSDSTRLSIKGNSGPGSSEDEPIVIVVEWAQMRSAPKVRYEKLPDAMLREPRYLYYRVYKKEGAMPSKTPFDPDDDTLGRVDIFLITPPHTVISLKYSIAKAEGVFQEIRLFEDMDGEVLMSDDDHLSFSAQTYPGCTEDEPIMLLCGEVGQGNDKKPEPGNRMFSVRITARTSWTPGDPSWLPLEKDEVLVTDGVAVTATLYNRGMLFKGYMAINSAGRKGFVQTNAVTF